jgi:four helix bundle protein
MHNFKNIIAWQKAMSLVKDVYLLMEKFPKQEVYGLASQVNRSAISIPSNIAEGSGRNSNKDFMRFLDISISSSFELETQILLAKELGFITDEKMNAVLEKLTEVQKLIFGFQKTLNSN